MAKAKVVSVKHMAKGNNKVEIEYLDPIAPKLAYQRIAKEDEVLSKVLERYYPNLDKAVRRAVLSLQDTVLRGIGSGGGGEDEEETSEAFLDTGNVRLKACTPVILPDIYTAAEDETPTSIKNTFGCDVNELLTVNRYQTGYEKLASSSKLKEGTQIVIPPCWRPGAAEVQVPKHRLQRPVVRLRSRRSTRSSATGFIRRLTASTMAASLTTRLSSGGVRCSRAWPMPRMSA